MSALEGIVQLPQPTQAQRGEETEQCHTARGRNVGASSGPFHSIQLPHLGSLRLSSGQNLCAKMGICWGR